MPIAHPLPPCDKPEHDFEMMLRCTCCGFLIRCENPQHKLKLAERFFIRSAVERILAWLS